MSEETQLPIEEVIADEAGTSSLVSEVVDVSTTGRPERKVRLGVVISNKMQKTVVVRVDRSIRHPLYGRTVSRSRHFKAHDELNECGIGDRVEISETRPLSREKRWRVARIVERAK